MNHLLFGDEERQDWTAFLLEWETLVYPVFASYGFSRNTAITVWMLNSLANEIADSRGTVP